MANFNTKNKSVEELPGGKGSVKTHGTLYNFSSIREPEADRSALSKLISKKTRQREAYEQSLRVDEVNSAEELDEETLAWIDEMDRIYNTPEAQVELSQI